MNAYEINQSINQSISESENSERELNLFERETESLLILSESSVIFGESENSERGSKF